VLSSAGKMTLEAMEGDVVGFDPVEQPPPPGASMVALSAKLATVLLLRTLPSPSGDPDKLALKLVPTAPERYWGEGQMLPPVANVQLVGPIPLCLIASEDRLWAYTLPTESDSSTAATARARPWLFLLLLWLLAFELAICVFMVTSFGHRLWRRPETGGAGLWFGTLPPPEAGWLPTSESVPLRRAFER